MKKVREGEFGRNWIVGNMVEEKEVNEERWNSIGDEW